MSTGQELGQTKKMLRGGGGREQPEMAKYPIEGE